MGVPNIPANGGVIPSSPGTNLATTRSRTPLFWKFVWPRRMQKLGSAVKVQSNRRTRFPPSSPGLKPDVVRQDASCNCGDEDSAVTEFSGAGQRSSREQKENGRYRKA